MAIGEKVVVLTGASGTLGLALARRLLEEPLAGLVLSDIDLDAAEKMAAEYASGPVPVICVRCDVSDRDDFDGLLERTTNEFGRLGVLFNNAGTLAPNGRIHNLTVADWERCIKVNLMGAVNGTWAATRRMRHTGGGVIVNTASVAGMTAWPYAAPYGATKAAIINLTQVAAVEYARDGIRVNCVCPGTFASGIHADLPSGSLDAMGARHPLGLGTAEDVVGAFLYLAGNESAWTTGTALVVDGGYSAP